MSTRERIEANVAAAQTKPVTREACVEPLALGASAESREDSNAEHHER